MFTLTDLATRLDLPEAQAIATKVREEIEALAPQFQSATGRERLALVLARTAEIERRPPRTKCLLVGALLERTREAVAAIAEERRQ